MTFRGEWILDPIRLNLGGVIPLSTVDWTGAAASVIFFRGCPLKCPHCHNASLREGSTPANVRFSLEGISVYNEGARGGTRRSRQSSLLQITPQPARSEMNEAGLFVSCVVLSGGEPLMQPLACKSICKAAKGLGLFVGVETCGYYPDVLDELIGEGLLDTVFLDIKAAMNEEGYLRATGDSSAASKAAESLEICMRSGVSFEVRVTVFPDMEIEGDLDCISSYIKHLLLRYPENCFQRLVLQQGETKDCSAVDPEVLESVAGGIKGLSVLLRSRPRPKNAFYLNGDP